MFEAVRGAGVAAAAQGPTRRAGFRVAIAAILLLACVLAGCVAYLCVGLAFDGSLPDWFERNMMRQQFVNVNGQGLMYGVRVVDWTDVRAAAQGAVACAVVVACAVACVAATVAWWVARHRAVRQVERIIDDMYEHGDVYVERYPRAFATIAARLGELKHAIRRREDTIKGESGRKNELITYLAHDLKTPLASVVGYLNLLCETPDMPVEQRAKCLDVTLAKATQLESLIEEFFDVARYSLQQIELDRAPVDLQLMLVQLTEEFAPLSAEHGNTIELACPPDLTVTADAERLARVFNNLLKNAVAYSWPGTPIDIAVLRNPQTVCIRFSSRGDTIPRQKLDLIFEKFYRVDEARSTRTGGAGLGLAIAKEIVELHGGAITAVSEAGVTTFTVVLPAA